MNNTYYTPPKSDLLTENSIEVPEEIKKKIKRACIAGVISISTTLIFTILSMTGTVNLGLDATAFVDIVLMSVFTFGTYKYSRTCAVLLFLLFVLNKVMVIVQSGRVGNLLVPILFLYFYGQGVIGTFSYHRYVKAQKESENI